MDNWTQLGVSGLTLFILFFIVRYFVSALKQKDQQYLELTEKFIKITEDNTIEKINLKNAIDANTAATRQTADSLTKLVMDVVKTK